MQFDPASLVVAVFLALFLLRWTIETGLEGINLAHVLSAPPSPPASLRGHISDETALRSREYTIARERLTLLQTPIQAAVVLTLLFSGILPWLDALLTGWGVAGIHRGVAFMVLLSVLLSVPSIPFSLYRRFGIETRFGFNRMTLGLWLVDKAKGLALATVLGLPFLYGVFAFMAFTGVAWWLWLFGFITAVEVLLMWLYPAVIAPLFNRFSPLPPGELRRQLEEMARNAGFRTRGLFVVDASRRSGHSNAYFAGFWAPRIVLFDTLVRQLSPGEITAVLAHEIGHYKRRHIVKRLAISIIVLLAMLYMLSLLIGWLPVYQAFGFSGTSHHAALALAMLCSGAFTFWMAPLSALYSRRHEYEADAFAVSLLGQGADMKSALLRMNEENLTNLYPHPWYSGYHYSHPTLTERLAALDGPAAQP